MADDSASPWNINIHYHRLIRDAARQRGRALDVGCGNGLLSFDLADDGFSTVGIDVDRPSIERARSHPRATDNNEFVCGDFFSHRFESASFDLVASSATLHHLDARAGLARMKELVRPGGVVAVVSFARESGPQDYLLSAAGQALKASYQLRGRYWEHDAPICWPPPMTINEMANLAETELPGATFRRRMSNRYSLIWHAPPA